MFQRQIFRKMFFSYISIIFICFFVYTAVILYENSIISRERTRRLCEVKAEELGNILKKRILYAENIVLNLNYSQSLKKLYLSHVSGTVLDSYTLSLIREELRTTQTSSGLMVDGTVIFLNNSNRAYTSSGIISISETYRETDHNMPYISVGTLRELMKFEDTNRYLFNREFLIYCDDYTYQNGSDIGLICVLFNLETLKSDIEKILDGSFGAEILLDEKILMNFGSSGSGGYLEEYYVMPGISVRLYAPEGRLINENLHLIYMMLIIFVISASLIIMAYWFSRKYYQPINHIESLVIPQNNRESAQLSVKYPNDSEMDRIIRGIQNLIGEKNRYREKMLTITPYAQTGMLHGVLLGNIENDTIRILIEENYMDLIKPYFIVSVVNFAFQEQMPVVEKYHARIQEVIRKACRQFSTEEIHIVHYNRDIYNTFLIVNFENDEPMNELFYQVFRYLQENVRRYKCVVTIGVDETKCNIGELKDACEGALNALNEMIIGGRGAVYFNDTQKDTDIDYYFPKNFTEKLTKLISKGRTDEIRKMLREIYDKNWNMGGTPKMYNALVDELHLSIIKALKEITDLNSLHVNIEKINSIATLEEIFMQESMPKSGLM